MSFDRSIVEITIGILIADVSSAKETVSEGHSSRLCGTYTILTIPTILVWKSRGERGQFEINLAFQTSAPVR
jgi:hypothetical protein